MTPAQRELIKRGRDIERGREIKRGRDIERGREMQSKAKRGRERHAAQCVAVHASPDPGESQH
jgi:hypothetical protein